MPHSANSNAENTGTTSAAAPAPRPDQSGSIGSETEYLAEQSEAARAAIGGVISDLKTNLRSGWEQATDVHRWIEHHPWLAVGAASAAGFAAAAAVTPAPGEAIGDKLSSVIHSAMAEMQSANGETEAEENGAARPEPARPGGALLWGMLLEPVVEIAKVALQNYLAAYMAGQATARATTPSEATCDQPASQPPPSASDVESTETNPSALA